jgi:replicative DNA helicase
MSIDSTLVSLVCNKPSNLVMLQQAGVTLAHFVEPYDAIWKYIEKVRRETGKVPSPDVIHARFKGVELHTARQRDMAVLTADIIHRKKFMDFQDHVETALTNASQDTLDDVLAELHKNLNNLSIQSGKRAVVDLFSDVVNERIIEDQKRLRRGEMRGLPTGLGKFDRMIGGLHRQRMVVVMARAGVGKSWINLLFVAHAVISGHRVVLFPLEMSLEETAYRLYTIFSSILLGEDKALKNLDLTLGKISTRKIAKLMRILEDKYAGQLFVADVSAMNDAYTVERIRAEVAIHRPDMFWVDYLTLMKAPGVGRDGAEDHMTVKALAEGVKGIAQSLNCVGGASAQVNRESLRVKQFLPRLEHLAFGDSIGHAADQVVSLAKRRDDLYYGVVKNRHGPEIGRTRVDFNVDRGVIKESEDQPDGDGVESDD